MKTETKEHWLCQEARKMTITTEARQRIFDNFLASLGQAISTGSMPKVKELHSALLEAEKIVDERMGLRSPSKATATQQQIIEKLTT